MVNGFRSKISEFGLIKSTDRILLAISGGVDSMLMLDLFRECQFNIAVAHCNFQLRGNSSDLDQQLVIATCQKWDIPVFTTAFETKKVADSSNASIEMVAREQRYGFFSELMTKNGYQFLATGHHINDNIETALIHFAKGGGLQSLTGIPEAVERIIRPMSAFTKSEIVAEAKARYLDWREDATNAENEFTRNRIRNKIVPVLKEINPSLEKTFYRRLQRISQVENWVSNEMSLLRNSEMNENKGVFTFAKTIFERFNDQPEMLRQFLLPYGFSYNVCQDILGSSLKSGLRFRSENYEMAIDRDLIFLGKYSNEHLEATMVSSLPSTIETKRGTLYLSKIEKKEIDWSLVGVQYLDLGESDQLKVRAWQDGDKIRPLGMKGFKKLSNVFIDKKTPVSVKKEVPIILINNEVACVAGLIISENFKVTAETKSVLSLNW